MQGTLTAVDHRPHDLAVAHRHRSFQFTLHGTRRNAANPQRIGNAGDVLFPDIYRAERDMS